MSGSRTSEPLDGLPELLFRSAEYQPVTAEDLLIRPGIVQRRVLADDAEDEHPGLASEPAVCHCRAVPGRSLRYVPCLGVDVHVAAEPDSRHGGAVLAEDPEPEVPNRFDFRGDQGARRVVDPQNPGYQLQRSLELLGDD